VVRTRARPRLARGTNDSVTTPPEPPLPARRHYPSFESNRAAPPSFLALSPSAGFRRWPGSRSRLESRPAARATLPCTRLRDVAQPGHTHAIPPRPPDARFDEEAGRADLKPLSQRGLIRAADSPPTLQGACAYRTTANLSERKDAGQSIRRLFFAFFHNGCVVACLDHCCDNQCHSQVASARRVRSFMDALISCGDPRSHEGPCPTP
jgi:hypothetical protein